MSPAPTPETDGDPGHGTGPVAPPPPPPPAAPAPAPSPAAPAPASSPDADLTKDPRLGIATQLALAEAMKPIEAAAATLYPEGQMAQTAIAAKYDAAVAAGGDLRKKVDAANDKFGRAAADMLDRLDAWVEKFASGPLHELLDQRKDTEDALDTRRGSREATRDAAADDAKAWAANFADWSAPADAIGKIVGSYVDQIDKLNADINNDVAADAAMLSFWFDVAPKHLQVSDKELSGNAGQARDKVKKALGDAGYTDLADALDPAKAHAAGKVHVIAAGAVPDKRKSVLACWQDSAKALADAQAAYKLDPDDAATLKARWDKLKDDAWLKDAKAALTPPAS